MRFDACTRPLVCGLPLVLSLGCMGELQVAEPGAGRGGGAARDGEVGRNDAAPMGSDAAMFDAAMFDAATGVNPSVDGSAPSRDGAGARADGSADAGAPARDASRPRFDVGPLPDADRAPIAAWQSLADNTLVDLGPYVCNEPAGDPLPCEGIVAYSGIEYDPHRGRLLMFGGGHAASFTDTIAAFDLTTLTWSELYTPTPCASMTPSNLDRSRSAWLDGPSGPYPRPISRHTYDLLVIPPTRPELIMAAAANGGQSYCPSAFDWSGSDPFFITGKVAHYDFTTGTWSFSATAENDTRPDYSYGYPAAEYDPPLDSVIILGGPGLYRYDMETREKRNFIRGHWGEFRDASGNQLRDDIGYANELVYYPPNQNMYLFERRTDVVFEVVLDRADLSRSTVTRMQTSGQFPPHAEPGFDYDWQNQVIGGGLVGNRFYVFDPITATWTNELVQGGSPGTSAMHAVEYDPVNNVFLILTDNPSGTRLWAYRYRGA